MAYILKRPMFRKGGLSQETGIMSGLDRRGYAQGSYAPRVRYQGGFPGVIGGHSVPYGGTAGTTAQNVAKRTFMERLKNLRNLRIPTDVGIERWVRGLPGRIGQRSLPGWGATRALSFGIPSALAAKAAFTTPGEVEKEYGISKREKVLASILPGGEYLPLAIRNLIGERTRDVTTAEAPPSILSPGEKPDETLLDEKEKQSIESDFESVYKDILPIFKRELAADPESTAKEKYIALAQFGSRLLGEPGGDLAGAVGRAAEKPLEEVGKIMAKETKAKRSAKEAALTIAAQKYLKDDAVKDKVEGFKKYLPNTSEEEIAKQLLLPAGTENIKLRILEDNKKVFLEHMGDPANVKGGNTYAGEQLYMSENQEKFKGINFKELPIKDSVIKTDKIPEKGDYYINPETGEHGFMSKDGTWTSITEKDFPSFV